MHIRNPVEWGVDQIRSAGTAIELIGHARHRQLPMPVIRQITLSDLHAVLRRGLEDFAAFRTDVVFLCVIYPLAGLVLARLVFGYELLPLLFPLASGFALLGPVAAVGLYELSRRREAGEAVGWAAAFGVVRSPAFGTIVAFGLLLMAIFLLWLNAAILIYDATLGPEPPATLYGFAHDVLATKEGWAMIVIGIGVGFLFAVAVLAISVVSVPMILDREVGLMTAVETSLRACAANPGPMAAWGFIIAALLVIGSLPLFIGLVIVMPVLGHASWHLYRRVVAAG